MTSRGTVFVALLAPIPSERARLRAGLPELHALYRDCIRAAAPPNPQFERERIIAQAPNPRELAFLLGLFNEGENEAALLLELVDAVWTSDPNAVVAHLVDEAWYYLRTSIDAGWQLDTGEPSLTAAVVYLFFVLEERLAVLAPPASPPAGDPASRFALLRSLRDDFGVS